MQGPNIVYIKFAIYAAQYAVIPSVKNSSRLGFFGHAAKGKYTEI